MAKGKDERHNPNRKPIKPVLFSDVNDTMYGKPNRFDAEPEADPTEFKKIIDEEGNEAWSYKSDDEYEDDERYNSKRKVDRTSSAKPLDVENMSPEEIGRRNAQLQEASRAISKIIGWNG